MKRAGCILALSLCFVSPASAADPPLVPYGIDIQQTSVSGVSSGAAMAVQMHIAHSSIMRGVGVIAGVAYDCADSSQPSSALRLLRGLSCMDGSIDYASAAINRTTAASATPGAIDDPSANLPRQKIWLFSGYNDGLVRRSAMNTVAAYYLHYVSHENIFYKTTNHAPHALVTDDYGLTCLDFGTPYINNCQYDAAGFLLKHIYGSLNQPGKTLTSSVQAFDQREFTAGVEPASIGLADTGYVYVPAACKTETCRVHVVFHGCKQYAGTVGDAVYKHGGYNKWADLNNLIVLYPQTVPVLTGPVGPPNPDGCWDWWGFTNDQEQDFARKTGHQIAATKRMLDRLAQKFAPGGGSSGPFGTPQNFRATDSTSVSVELTWNTNTAAAGFNIYRSLSSGGPYAKRNTQIVSGASFADQGLSAQTTYYYKITAIDGSNHESAPTNPVAATTAPDPPACDPFMSINQVHVDLGRAIPGVTDTLAMGSWDPMGPLTSNDLRQLIREWPAYYRARYCP
jgi:poly(3-hydroxybutyrate) depolymerase